MGVQSTQLNNSDLELSWGHFAAVETRRFLRYELMERGNVDHDQVEGGVFCRAEWKGC